VVDAGAPVFGEAACRWFDAALPIASSRSGGDRSSLPHGEGKRTAAFCRRIAMLD
jgi:hypothetical protein